MHPFLLSQLQSSVVGDRPAYHEFLRVESMSGGLYFLPASARDPQGPHSQDEVYHVLRGTGILRVGSADHRVGPGTIAFVGAGEQHRFHSIDEDLLALVVFAPPEKSGTTPR